MKVTRRLSYFPVDGIGVCFILVLQAWLERWQTGGHMDGRSHECIDGWIGWMLAVGWTDRETGGQTSE